MVVTHDQAVAGRMHRRIEMLDGRIITDTAAPSAPAPRGGRPAAGAAGGLEGTS